MITDLPQPAFNLEAEVEYIAVLPKGHNWQEPGIQRLVDAGIVATYEAKLFGFEPQAAAKFARDLATARVGNTGLGPWAERAVLSAASVAVLGPEAFRIDAFPLENSAIEVSQWCKEYYPQPSPSHGREIRANRMASWRLVLALLFGTAVQP